MKLRTPGEVKSAIETGTAGPALELAERCVTAAEKAMLFAQTSACVGLTGITPTVYQAAINLLQNAGWQASFHDDQRDGAYIQVVW